MRRIPLGPDGYVEQLATPSLGDHSYVVSAGDYTVVVDPQRDIERFVRAVEASGRPAVAVVETHVHNDYVSGGPLLADAVAAEYRVPAESGMLAPHRIIAAGDRIDLGDNWRIRAIATPGHTPHHTSYFVDGGNGSGVALTGGSMLVGAVGRTDLLGSELTLELTRAQYRSVRGLAGTLDGDVVVAPTHGAGSFCAAPPTTAAISTIDGEWTHNPALIEESEDRFVADQIAGFRLYPTYYREMAPINRIGAGPPPVSNLPVASASDIEAAPLVIDLRDARSFAAGHVPGSINIPYSDTASAWAGWVAPWGAPVILIGPVGVVDVMRIDLARVGWDAVTAAVTDGLAAWTATGRSLRSYRVADFTDLVAEVPDLVVDSRDPKEAVTIVPGAFVCHPSAIAAADLPTGSPWLHCVTGHRAAIASSILDAKGLQPVLVLDDLARYRGPLVPR